MMQRLKHMDKPALMLLANILIVLAVIIGVSSLMNDDAVLKNFYAAVCIILFTSYIKVTSVAASIKNVKSKQPMVSVYSKLEKAFME